MRNPFVRVCSRCTPPAWAQVTHMCWIEPRLHSPAMADAGFVDFSVALSDDEEDEFAPPKPAAGPARGARQGTMRSPPHPEAIPEDDDETRASVDMSYVRPRFHTTHLSLSPCNLESFLLLPNSTENRPSRSPPPPLLLLLPLTNCGLPLPPLPPLPPAAAPVERR